MYSVNLSTMHILGHCQASILGQLCYVMNLSKKQLQPRSSPLCFNRVVLIYPESFYGRRVESRTVDLSWQDLLVECQHIYRLHDHVIAISWLFAVTYTLRRQVAARKRLLSCRGFSHVKMTYVCIDQTRNRGKEMEKERKEAS